MAELNIAIADDNRQTLELLGEILEGEKDYHVVGKADNGNEAYNMIMKTRPDVVLMDIVMPGMDGISVMEKIKSNAEMKDSTSFIMVTALPSASLIVPLFVSPDNRLSFVTIHVDSASMDRSAVPLPPFPAQDSSWMKPPVRMLPSVILNFRLLILSQITSPSIFWFSAVKEQSAPFAPLCPQPLLLAFPVHFKKNSLLEDGVILTLFK